MLTIRDRIIPSAPFKSFAEIENLADKVKGELKRIQIDVCDGKYVGNISWPFREFEGEEFKNIGTTDMIDVTLPNWESINYSVDLMCENPQNYIDSFVTYGVDEIIIHFRTIEKNLEVFGEIVEKGNMFELNLVLAVDVKTDLNNFVNFVKNNLENIDAIQVMGIEKIGFQGQVFDQRSLEIVKKLKQEFGDLTIYFDGALNQDTISECVEAGVDVFCIGSYLTAAANFSENLQVVKNLLRE